MPLPDSWFLSSTTKTKRDLYVCKISHCYKFTMFEVFAWFSIFVYEKKICHSTYVFISFFACCFYPEQASRKKIPILVDAEKKRDGLDELLQLADYVVCTAKFPQVS